MQNLLCLNNQSEKIRHVTLLTTLLLNFWLNIKAFQLSACILYMRSGNSVDPDQLASQKPADLDQLCFKTGRFWVQHVRVEFDFKFEW